MLPSAKGRGVGGSDRRRSRLARRPADPEAADCGGAGRCGANSASMTGLSVPIALPSTPSRRPTFQSSTGPEWPRSGWRSSTAGRTLSSSATGLIPGRISGPTEIALTRRTPTLQPNKRPLSQVPSAFIDSAIGKERLAVRGGKGEPDRQSGGRPGALTPSRHSKCMSTWGPMQVLGGATELEDRDLLPDR